MQNVLEVKGLTKKYGDQYALKDVSLSIKKGEIYGLIGKNGAGKTTLIKIITQVIYPSGGTVSVLGSQNQQEWTKALSHSGSVIETPVACRPMKTCVTTVPTGAFQMLTKSSKKPCSTSA